MHVIVLGSAAGGGVPQWNCACDNCEAIRRSALIGRRTQDSVAVTANGERWVLLNASPDFRQQLEAAPQLWPRNNLDAVRNTPIAAVALTNGDLDHCLGLFSMREWTPFSLYATQATYDGLVSHNAMARTFDRQHRQLHHHPLTLGERLPILDVAGKPVGLSIIAFGVVGKLPLHLEKLQTASPEMNVGLLIEQDDGGQRLAYVPGAGAIDGIASRVAGADCLLLDGTFWSDDELSRQEPSGKTAKQMAHWPVGGPDGSLSSFEALSVQRRLFTHVNNTNPMLLPGSPEWTRVHDSGWTVAEDGMEFQW